MTRNEVLQNIIADYDKDIDYLHNQVVELYQELSNCRNKRQAVKQLLTDNKYE